MVLPTQIVVDASSLHKCTDEEGASMLASNSPHACMLCPLFLLHKKRKWYVSSSYSQSEAQMNHPQKIS